MLSTCSPCIKRTLEDVHHSESKKVKHYNEINFDKDSFFKISDSKLESLSQNDYDSLRESTDKDSFFESLLKRIIEDEKYIASTLLRFAVINNDLETEKFLLTKHEADPRIKDEKTEESALTCALDRGDFKAIQTFIQYNNLTPQPIQEDFITIGSIYDAITSLHEYEAEDLLHVLGYLYTDIHEIF